MRAILIALTVLFASATTTKADPVMDAWKQYSFAEGQAMGAASICVEFVGASHYQLRRSIAVMNLQMVMGTVNAYKAVKLIEKEISKPEFINNAKSDNLDAENCLLMINEFNFRAEAAYAEFRGMQK